MKGERPFGAADAVRPHESPSLRQTSNLENHLSQIRESFSSEYKIQQSQAENGLTFGLVLKDMPTLDAFELDVPGK